MSVSPVLSEPVRIEEPAEAQKFAEVLTQVATSRLPAIVRRGGEDLAAVISLADLELFRELLAREDAERLASSIDWDRVVKTSPPPQSWFEGDEPRPF